MSNETDCQDRVVLDEYWDVDRHDLDCDCGLCHSATHKSYGVGIFPIDNKEDPLDVVYAPSREAASHNARMECQKNNWRIVACRASDEIF